MTTNLMSTDTRAARQAYYAEYGKRDYVKEANRRAQAARHRRLVLTKTAMKIADMTHDEIMDMFNDIFACRHADFASKRDELAIIAAMLARPANTSTHTPEVEQTPVVEVPTTEP